MSFKRDGQRHLIQVFCFLTTSCYVSCCPLSFFSLLVSICAMVHDVVVVLWLKSALELDFQIATVRFWLEYLADLPAGVFTVISGW